MLSWQQRIDRAREIIVVGGWFSKRETIRGFSRDDRALALDWMTCGCGMLDARIPRQFNTNHQNMGRPVDSELGALGVNFYRAIAADEVDHAEAVYRKIQTRAELLIEQLESTPAPIADQVQAK